MTISGNHSGLDTTYTTAANLSIEIEGTTLAYRDLGPRGGVPVVLLNHWGAGRTEGGLTLKTTRAYS